MKKVGQNPLDPQSLLVLCSCCGARTARIYDRFPGLCDVCARVAYACCNPDATLDINRAHGLLSASTEDMRVVMHIFREAGFQEATGVIGQAIELLENAYEKILAELDAKEQAYLATLEK